MGLLQCKAFAVTHSVTWFKDHVQHRSPVVGLQTVEMHRAARSSEEDLEVELGVKQVGCLDHMIEGLSSASSSAYKQGKILQDTTGLEIQWLYHLIMEEAELISPKS